MMTMSRLLKSWAMPPASRPTASIFCDWRSCSSSRRLSSSAWRRSVTSVNITAIIPGAVWNAWTSYVPRGAVVAVGDLGPPGASLGAEATVAVRDLGAGEAGEGLLDRPADEGVHRGAEDPVARGVRAGEHQAVGGLEAVEVNPHRGRLDDRADPRLGLAKARLDRAPLLDLRAQAGDRPPQLRGRVRAMPTMLSRLARKMPRATGGPGGERGRQPPAHVGHRDAHARDHDDGRRHGRAADRRRAGRPRAPPRCSELAAGVRKPPKSQSESVTIAHSPPR